MQQALTVSSFLLISWLHFSFVHGQVSDLAADKRYLREVVEAHLANLEGWQRFDVLLRYDMVGHGRLYEDDGAFLSGPSSMSVEVRKKGLVRLVVDFERDCVLILNRKEDEAQIFDSLDQERGDPIRRSDDRMVVVDKSRRIGVGRNLPGGAAEMIEIPPIESLLREFSVPNLKAFGTGYSWDSWRSTVLIDSLNYQSQPDFISSVSNVGKERYQVRLDGKSSNRESENQPRAFIDWDYSDNIPIKYVIYPSKSSTKPTTLETVEWKKVNGSALPHTSRRSFSSTDAFDNGLKFYVEYEQTTELHWFSFNEELADELFDPNLLKDRAKVDELLSDSVFEKK
jgi:hypothetical protein